MIKTILKTILILLTIIPLHIVLFLVIFILILLDKKTGIETMNVVCSEIKKYFNKLFV